MCMRVVSAATLVTAVNRPVDAGNSAGDVVFGDFLASPPDLDRKADLFSQTTSVSTSLPPNTSALPREGDETREATPSPSNSVYSGSSTESDPSPQPEQQENAFDVSAEPVAVAADVPAILENIVIPRATPPRSSAPLASPTSSSAKPKAEASPRSAPVASSKDAAKPADRDRDRNRDRDRERERERDKKGDKRGSSPPRRRSRSRSRSPKSGDHRVGVWLPGPARFGRSKKHVMCRYYNGPKGWYADSVLSPPLLCKHVCCVCYVLAGAWMATCARSPTAQLTLLLARLQPLQAEPHTRMRLHTRNASGNGKTVKDGNVNAKGNANAKGSEIGTGIGIGAARLLTAAIHAEVQTDAPHHHAAMLGDPAHLGTAVSAVRLAVTFAAIVMPQLPELPLSIPAVTHGTSAHHASLVAPQAHQGMMLARLLALMYPCSSSITNNQRSRNTRRSISTRGRLSSQ